MIDDVIGIFQFIGWVILWLCGIVGFIWLLYYAVQYGWLPS
jgi:hypothetical protein